MESKISSRLWDVHPGRFEGRIWEKDSFPPPI